MWLSLWLIPVAALVVALGTDNVFSQIAIFFSKMAMVTFGGAYAVLAYVAQQAVENYGWLTPQEMLDGLGMAETTPGPLIMVLQFVGFLGAYRDPGTLPPLLAATLGGLLATWVTFAPCFMWIFVGAPFMERLRGVRALSTALTAITAAVVGVILNLAIWLAIHTIFSETVPVEAWPFSFDAPVLSSLNPWVFGLSLAAAVAIFWLEWGMIPTLAASCGVGWSCTFWVPFEAARDAKRSPMMRQMLSIFLLGACLALSSHALAADIDWSKVDAAFGKPATVQGDVHRYRIPRSDLQVNLDGVAIKPALALGGWVAFAPARDSAMVMGDLVLTETEVNPVMTKLLQGGIEITALHNHLMRAIPATFYMHIRGHGDPVKLATAIREALAESKTPFEAPGAYSAQPAEIDLDSDKLDQALGAKGKVNGGVYQFSIPRRDPITEDGMSVPPAMGTDTVINFQPTGGGKAAIAGDFVMTADEVNPVIGALRETGIEVVAIHSHMLEETPRLIFLHFWANGDALKLATGLRSALEKTAVARS